MSLRDNGSASGGGPYGVSWSVYSIRKGLLKGYYAGLDFGFC